MNAMKINCIIEEKTRYYMIFAETEQLVTLSKYKDNNKFNLQQSDGRFYISPEIRNAYVRFFEEKLKKYLQNKKDIIDEK